MHGLYRTVLVIERLATNQAFDPTNERASERESAEKINEGPGEKS